MKFEKEKPTVSVEVRMTEAERESLKKLAKTNGLTMSKLIRRALDAYIKTLEQIKEEEEA